MKRNNIFKFRFIFYWYYFFFFDNLLEKLIKSKINVIYLLNIRAGRASKIGARAGRIVRIFRLIRLVKLYKAAQQVIDNRNEDDDIEFGKGKSDLEHSNSVNKNDVGRNEES